MALNKHQWMSIGLLSGLVLLRKKTEWIGPTFFAESFEAQSRDDLIDTLIEIRQELAKEEGLEDWKNESAGPLDSLSSAFIQELIWYMDGDRDTWDAESFGAEGPKITDNEFWFKPPNPEDIISELRDLGMPEIIFEDDEERIKINGELVYQVTNHPREQDHPSIPLFHIGELDYPLKKGDKAVLNAFHPSLWIRTPKGLIKNVVGMNRNEILERKIQRRLMENYGEYAEKKPFECLCGKRFKSENALKKHQRDKKHTTYHTSHTLFDDKTSSSIIRSIENPDGITLREVYLMLPNWNGDYHTWKSHNRHRKDGGNEPQLKTGLNYFAKQSFEAEDSRRQLKKMMEGKSKAEKKRISKMVQLRGIENTLAELLANAEVFAAPASFGGPEDNDTYHNLDETDWRNRDSCEICARPFRLNKFGMNLIQHYLKESNHGIKGWKTKENPEGTRRTARNITGFFLHEYRLDALNQYILFQEKTKISDKVIELLRLSIVERIIAGDVVNLIEMMDMQDEIDDMPMFGEGFEKDFEAESFNKL